MHCSRKPGVASFALGVALAVDVPGDPSFAADPSAALPATDLVGVGSDTAQDVMAQLGSTLATTGYGPNYNATTPANRLWGFYATGSVTIVPQTGCAAITRPSGSSAGIAAPRTTRPRTRTASTTRDRPAPRTLRPTPTSPRSVRP
jgi:hypothetical protein